jgi:dTDP-glucose 4,6-dehydratase
VYGKGLNVRDWIHVEDHCRGVLLAFEKGEIGGTYCLGGRSERKNLDVVIAICSTLDELRPKPAGSYKDQIRFVEDRKGHDFRYAIDDSFAEKSLGFHRIHQTFEKGLRQTIQWYLDNPQWIERIQKGEK